MGLSMLLFPILLLQMNLVYGFVNRFRLSMVATNNYNVGYVSKFGSTVTTSDNTMTLKPSDVDLGMTSNSLSGSLPFLDSIDSNSHLTYMDAVKYQINIMSSMGFEKLDLMDQFTHRVSDIKPAKISNMNFKSDIFRKIFEYEIGL